MEIGQVEVVYATFHVDVGETPFFVALDYSNKKVSILLISNYIYIFFKGNFFQQVAEKNSRFYKL